MEYGERLANFRQTRLNPFDRSDEEDGPQGGKTPPRHGKVYHTSTCHSFCVWLTYGFLQRIYLEHMLLILKSSCVFDSNATGLFSAALYNTIFFHSVVYRGHTVASKKRLNKIQN